MPVIDPSPSDDQSLDVLLRGRPRSWPDRLRTAVAGRPAIAGGVAAVAVVGLVVLGVLGRSRPASVTLPRAGAAPTGTVVEPDSAVTSTGLPGGPGLDPRPDQGVTPGSTARSTVGGSQTSAHLVVHVAGAVARPGLVDLPAGSRVADAVDAAGGLRSDADGDRVNLAQPVADGERVYVPAVGQATPPAAVAIDGAAPGGAADGRSGGSPTPSTPVDLNSATVDELDALPGVGPSTAAAIVAYRDAHGGFRTVDELDEVRGIGPAKFEALVGLVAVAP